MAWALVALCSMAAATTINSDFVVVTMGSEKATMSHYSYLKDMALNSQYSNVRGLKTGDFNYLVDGRFTFDDYYRYYDGHRDVPIGLTPPGANIQKNSTVTHEMKVDFEGEKGISEIYGEGFFPSNRGISAAKKIRYDDVSGYDLGNSYMASKFDVNAYIDIGPSAYQGHDYSFDWEANVTDAVVLVREGMGWSNITKGRKTDWEREALIQGTTHIINTLYADGLYIPGAGQEDWLPCCCNTRDYINGSIMAAVNWPNINQKMIFDCSCPSGSTEGLQNYWAPAAQGVGYIPAAGGKYYMYGTKDWYYDPSYYGFPGQVGVKAFQPPG